MYRAPTFGVPVVGLGTPDLTAALPTSTWGALATVTAASQAPTAGSWIKTSNNRKLSGTYTVSISLIGYDNVNQGYTVNQCPAFSAPVAVTSGNGILVRLPETDFPSGMSEAIACIVWLQKGSANAQAVKFAYLNPQYDFSTLVLTEPIASVPFVPTGTLTAATATSYLGSRDPYSITFPSYLPTTGGVKNVHRATRMTVSQDDVVDYDLITARATEVQFSVMSNAPTILANALGGNTWSWSDTDSTTVTEVEFDMYAVVSNTPGNLPLSIIMPPDNNGISAQRMHFGNLTVNNTENTEDYLKTTPYKLDFSLQPAALDTLLEGLHTGIQFYKT